MSSLDSLKALLQKKKQEKQELVGDKKYVKRSELEEARLKRLREEEEQERRAKEEKRRKLLGGSATPDGRPTTPDPAAADAAADGTADGTAAAAGTPSKAAAADSAPALPREEVIRRLRALGQPATLFGEEDADRQARLRKVEKTVVLADEARGGQQENVINMLKRQEKLSKQQGKAAGDTAAGEKAGKAAADKASKAAADKAGKAAAEKAAAAAAAGEGPSKEAAAGDASSRAAAAGDGSGSAAAAGGGSSGDDVLAAFQEAASRLAAQREEEALPVEDRIVKYLQCWCKEWEEDLESRSEEVKMSGAGSQATMVYRQSMTYLEPLYERLKRRQLVEELKVGLWIMVQHMANRNYLAANDVYLKLAIGNAPWPIGVTHVGLHERSAREKISHVMNSSSQAHIMNDEATRKYFQAIKRLMTNMQRLRPTDPSRCMDFDVYGDEGRGTAGGGSNRAALLAAQAKGEMPLALPAAPHLVAPDGSVRIPPKWKNVLRREAASIGVKDGAGSESDSDQQQQGSGKASKTPPRSPLPA